MELCKNWKFWLVFLMFGMLAINPFLIAEDDEEDGDEEEDGAPKGWVEAVGKGSSKAGATTEAINKALLAFVKKDMESEDYNAHLAEIKSLIGSNWKQYIQGDPKIVKPYNEDTRKIVIRIKIDGDQLLNDLKSKLTTQQEKLAGMAIYAKHDVEPVKEAKDEWLDYDVGFDSFRDVMSRYGATFYDPKATETARQKTPGLDDISDPKMAAYLKFIDNNIELYLMIKTDRYITENKDQLWQATISCRAVWKQEGKEFFRFQVRSGDKAGEFADKNVPKAYANPLREDGKYYISERDARSRAIKDLAIFVAEQAAERVANNKSLRANNYVFKFIGFTPSARDKVESALEDLSSGSRPKLKIINMSKVDDYLAVIGTWKATAHSPNKIAKIIQELCAENEVNARPDLMVRGMITFVPGK